MPKKTYGPQVKERVRRLLEALLCFVDREFEDVRFDIKHNNWIEEDSTNPKLIVQTTLVALECLTAKDKYPGKLTKAQIREALLLLKDFVKIMEDNRIQTKGSDDWDFTLKLWSRDREKNLKEFDEVWESHRPKKSKDLEEKFQKSSPVATKSLLRTNPFQAPPLPTYYVDRPEYSQDLKTRLLTESSDVQTLVVTAIHGLGAVGKSTIAMALAHDQQVQAHFSDGILWATLGQQPDVLPLLSGWVQALGDYNFKPTSIEAATNHLRTLLYDKAALLVVDDVWNTKDAQAFNLGRVRCQVLVTTREAVIAKVLGASIYYLDVMKPFQAMELLTKKLERDITGTECQEAETLAKEIGYLPLALELAAAQVASGTSWAVLLQDIQLEIARLKTFDDPQARDVTDEASLKRLSLRASLNLSVQRLKEEERLCFTLLGVLPEDATITNKMTVTLWELDDERDAKETLEYLRNKALLLPGVPLIDGTSSYRLHDLFHDLARNLLTAPTVPKRPGDLSGLGLTLVDAHRQFLERYREKTQNGQWHTLPDDGYIHQRLVWHLFKADRVDEIHELLQEETESGCNGWYEACDRLGQTGVFVTDVSCAWRLAEQMYEENTSYSISLQCFYALMVASLNSLATLLPSNLLIELINKKVWTPSQGIAYILQGSNPVEKASRLTMLANYLPATLTELALEKALAAAKQIQDKSSRAEALCALADKLPELLPDALAAAKQIQDETYRARVLSALAEKLPPELLPDVVAAAKQIQDESDRARVLSALANKLPELLPEALAATKQIQDESNRAYTLSALADKLPPELLPDALATIEQIQDDYSRAFALTFLGVKLPELFPKALAATKQIRQNSDTLHTVILRGLVGRLPPELLPEALAIAQGIQDEYSCALALSALADKLPELLPDALATAKRIQNKRQCVFVLSALANKLPLELLLDTLAAVKPIQDEFSLVVVLRALADKLPPEDALATAKQIQDERYRAEALCALANKLPPELLPDVLATAKQIQDERYRAKALCALANKLPPELLPDVLAVAQQIQDEWSCTMILCALANKLPPELLPEALAVAQQIQDEYSRARVLSALADKLPELLPEALAVAQQIQNEWCCAMILCALANKLPPELLPDALATAKQIQDEGHRAEALCALANKLPPELLPDVLAVAQQIQDERHHAEVLSALADKLPPELLPDAVAAAKQIQDESNRAKVLSALAEKLPELLPEALAAAKQIQDERNRAEVLSALAIPLSKMPATLLFSYWKQTLYYLSLRTRENLLTDIEKLVSVIFTLGGDAAIASVGLAIQKVARWWP